MRTWSLSYLVYMYRPYTRSFKMLSSPFGGYNFEPHPGQLARYLESGRFVRV